MGQTSSTVLREEEEEYFRRKAEWLKPITSRDQLVQRYRDVLRTKCLSFEERSWFESVFDKFASRPGYWSEADLTSFLFLSFPRASMPLVHQAGPVLYRLFLGVGSYPYHQDPVKELDFGTLRTAIVLLLGNDEQSFPLAEDSDEDEEEVEEREEEREDERGEGREEERENERALQVRTRYTRLLFQSLAPSTDLNTDEVFGRNDEDIIEALRIVSKRRILRHPHTPKIGTLAPERPPPSSLPPSYAELLSGRLTQLDLQILARLFLACQLHRTDTGPEQILVSSSSGLGKATSAIVGAFDLDRDGLCGWQSFHRVMAPLIPGVQTAMARILNSFIEKPESIYNEDEYMALPRGIC